MKNIRKYLAMASLVPFGILTYLFFVFPMMALKQLKYMGKARGIPLFDARGKFQAWMEKDRWNGFALVYCIILRDNPMDHPKYIRTLMHEGKHAEQFMRNGALQLLLYPLDSIKVFLTGDKNTTHAYYSNKYEVEARLAAGQPEIIDPKHWRDGKDDRWHWW